MIETGLQPVKPNGGILLPNHEPRLFVAIPLTRFLQDELHLRCSRLSQQLSFKKWVAKEDLHITLQFLGAVQRELIPSVHQALEWTVQNCSPFDLSIAQLGSFGPLARPRILWTGVSGDTASLAGLQKQGVEQLAPLGFPGEDRPYRPHITLAKHFRGNDSPESAIHQFEQADWAEALPLVVKEIVLFQTHMGQVPMYERVGTFPFSD